jgi:two-component system, NtrC family, sensor kinase
MQLTFTQTPFSQRQQSPLRFVLIILSAVFCAETSVMMMLMRLPQLPRWLESIADATLLSLLITPFAYYAIYLPFMRRIAQQVHIERELQQSEAQAKQRSQELAQALDLIQTEKMNSLNRMVAGIAHELNNPVTFIHGNIGYVRDYAQTLADLIYLYQRHEPKDPQIQAIVEEVDLDFLVKDLHKILTSMNDGSDRIRQIVLDLRTFSRLDESDFKSIQIHEGIDSTLRFLQNRLNPSGSPAIQVIKEYSELPPVACYAGQLNQVFMNVLSNAIDALLDAACPHPTIRILTHRQQPGWVSIGIQDNGKGMPESVIEKIFDPFFTTKPIGKGTGLGLSVSYQIVVDRHGGSLQCRSEPGKGAEFWIHIPISSATEPRSDQQELQKLHPTPSR